MDALTSLCFCGSLQLIAFFWQLRFTRVMLLGLTIRINVEAWQSYRFSWFDFRTGSFVTSSFIRPGSYKVLITIAIIVQAFKELVLVDFGFPLGHAVSLLVLEWVSVLVFSFTIIIVARNLQNACIGRFRFNFRPRRFFF